MAQPLGAIPLFIIRVAAKGLSGGTINAVNAEEAVDNVLAILQVETHGGIEGKSGAASAKAKETGYFWLIPHPL